LDYSEACINLIPEFYGISVTGTFDAQ
jgi:hypothetical protein